MMANVIITNLVVPLSVKAKVRYIKVTFTKHDCHRGICVSPTHLVFVEPACGKQDIVVTFEFGVCACVCPSEIVPTITSTIVDGFQNYLTQLFSITCRCAI